MSKVLRLICRSNCQTSQYNQTKWKKHHAKVNISTTLWIEAQLELLLC